MVLNFFGSSKPLHIRLRETTAQDLTLDLGPPSKVHYKEDQRMTIHSSKQADDIDDRGCKGLLRPENSQC